MKKGLYIVATPIGNLGDVSERALSVLRDADVVACEDTRVTKKLFSLLGISLKKTFLPLHDHNESEQSDHIIGLINNDKSVALVSDAGSPLISDPGYKLVKKCKEQSLYYTIVPGASAVISAIQLSGLPSNRFMFVGFIPNKEKSRRDLFEELKGINSTLIFYETAPRILKTLTAALEVFGDREGAVVREITKVYEESIGGHLSDIISNINQKPIKGEIVFLVAPPEEDASDIDIEAILKQKLKKLSLKDAVAEVVKEYKQNKNDVYEKALGIKNDSR
ncbi:MAG: 16S rRNA (cytidine(1402)-2'-O)-methyltransferase [Lactobacillus sp.]|jgi:16S rRNA (cytidine1402-2'-O)-methyltransferase|nr:16S rRNA (cytidine(1402)-2'-O)-methyltransferase [Lactobacillus sp.]